MRRTVRFVPRTLSRSELYSGLREMGIDLKVSAAEYPMKYPMKYPKPRFRGLLCLGAAAMRMV